MMYRDEVMYALTWSRYEGFNGFPLKLASHRGEGSSDISLSATNATTGERLSDEQRYQYPEDPQPIPGLTQVG